MKLPNLKYIKLRAYFEAEEAANLPPFLGSTIRGLLNVSMRRLVCVAPTIHCHQCELVKSCDYPNYFNTAGNIAGSVNPYILTSPGKNKLEWQSGDEASFDLTIFGEATEKLDYHIKGLINTENYGWGFERKKFKLRKIVNANKNKLVYLDGETWLDNARADELARVEREAASVLLKFTSPTRILVRRKLQTRPSFQQIIQSIMTRIGLLSHAYGGKELNWSETDLLERAGEIKVVEEKWRHINFKRYTRFRDAHLALPAVQGYARFEGDLTPFVPLLEMGRTVQIGKNTSHGFGHYELYYV